MIKRFLCATFLPLFALPALALAAGFPDVPSSNPFYAAVNGLAAKDVIGGNPDGTFRPHDPVNRAALLKMLYRAARMNATSATGCFTDVIAGSWYEPYVCDAKARGFVEGYKDGKFRPEQAVTRAEALKLTITVLGIPASDAEVNMYGDVALDEWFAPSVRTALAVKILPIMGQDGSRFSPSSLLERGEAAAYIWNALNIEGKVEEQVESSSSSEVSSVTARSSSSVSTVKPPEAPAPKSVSVPFSDTVSEGTPAPAYTFTTTGTQTMEITGLLPSGAPGTVSCRLYRISDNGFSDEYYLGIDDGMQCTIRAKIGAGSWQLQVQPSQKNGAYSVSTKTVAGDGNDGFLDARAFLKGKPHVELLDGGDLEDWYTFSVTADAAVVDKGGKDMTVKLISTSTIGCLIYPLKNVDLFGFQGPKCNELYRYPVGTYMVSVRHLPPKGVKATYSIELK